MKALVVYESMFGNSETIAQAVADGLADRFDVTLADARSMPRAAGVDVVVVGGPTHAFGLSRPATREDAVRQGATRTGVAEVGLREWLDTAPDFPRDTIGAAFDTSIGKPLTGSAGRKALRRLRRKGCRAALPAMSFHVTGVAGPLVAGERERARRWGEAVAEAVGDRD
ncbi:flavodoxin domain-containing protein [Actinoplanes sp. NPDC049265]|uniref:flavodoxin domain-containing protein n=1 Tax=Actinoplanes sp. NPDC049265 TaxID=3363902 RepID=UPI00372296EF